jgi:hypothetical protein
MNVGTFHGNWGPFGGGRAEQQPLQLLVDGWTIGNENSKESKQNQSAATQM